MLSLGVYAIGSRLRHIVRREICSPAIRSSKGVWRCLQVDGYTRHDYIQLFLFEKQASKKFNYCLFESIIYSSPILIVEGPLMGSVPSTKVPPPTPGL